MPTSTADARPMTSRASVSLARNDNEVMGTAHATSALAVSYRWKGANRKRSGWPRTGARRRGDASAVTIALGVEHRWAVRGQDPGRFRCFRFVGRPEGLHYKRT